MGRGKDHLHSLARRVSNKGDFRGAIRLASSEDVLADFDDDTYSALQSKHLTPPLNTCIPPPPTNPVSIHVSASEVMAAIQSFPNGSAGGPDKLRPQHLKDLVQGEEVPEESPFLCALADFCTLLLQGNAPVEVRPFLFGASLVALRKKSGGVRPIAVGCTLRRLAAKVASRMVRDNMASLLSPKQLGCGVRGGAEAAVHAARSFLSEMAHEHAVVKLDFQNAFNSIRRDKMLEATSDLAPEIFSFVHSYASYSSPTHLYWGDRLILSAEGVQQGDPLGPLLFCLTLHQYCQRFSSELCISYLDDISIGGSCKSILQDLAVVREAEDIGLRLNLSKSEIITRDHTTLGTLLTSLPGAQVMDSVNATFLGSPLGDDRCVSRAMIDALKRVAEKFVALSAHDALVLLRNAFAIPKVFVVHSPLLSVRESSRI